MSRPSSLLGAVTWARAAEPSPISIARHPFTTSLLLSSLIWPQVHSSAHRVKWRAGKKRRPQWRSNSLNTIQLVPNSG